MFNPDGICAPAHFPRRHRVCLHTFTFCHYDFFVLIQEKLRGKPCSDDREGSMQMILKISQSICSFEMTRIFTGCYGRENCSSLLDIHGHSSYSILEQDLHACV